TYSIYVGNNGEDFYYPALVEGGINAVAGELYELTEEHLAKLDEFESDDYTCVETTLDDGLKALAYQLKSQFTPLFSKAHPQLHSQEHLKTWELTPLTLSMAAVDVLNTADARDKAEKTREYAKAWSDGEIVSIGLTLPPDRPARPENPKLLAPTEMPKRRGGGSKENKIALLHAIAHIELNAIDLAWDIVARFASLYGPADPKAKKKSRAPKNFTLPDQFFSDWVKVADDEAKHHLMLQDRLADMNAAYGELPAHDGLWEAAERTAHDFPARLAVVPMVLEARGLDVTPNMISSMIQQGDEKTASMLRIIHDDEVTHVRAGTVWFESWCAYHSKDIEETWQALVREYFNGPLKKPFNHPSREDAGMLRDWYEPLAEEFKKPDENSLDE
ncbi:MAG: DUF455 family protein, partial [Micavibrio sp.]|nr:DUF455 family protein [Micavibrio sp.]